MTRCGATRAGRRLAVLLAPALCTALTASAQTVRIGAGEHPGFTRVVLMAAQPFDWHHAHSDTQLAVTLGGAGPVDLGRAFDRIGRTRLAALSLDGRHLTLHLGCACETLVWQERPGLVVIDLHDPAGAEEIGSAVGVPAETPTPSVPPAPMLPGPESLARAAGAGLARSLATLPAADPPPPPDPVLYSDAVAALAARIAGAVGEGLLEPAATTPTVASGVLPPAQAADTPPLPAPLHVESATGERVARDDPGTSGRCAMAPTLDFLAGAATADFATAFAPLIRDWSGEFDQPDPLVTRRLAELYLRNGFGAEARAVIDNASTPMEGRRLLLGLADLLEERQSNARHHLAGQIGCGGMADLLAALAGAGDAQVREQATGIVIAYLQLPAPLRLILGPALARRLIEGGAVEGGRVVTESLQRLTDPPPPEIALLEALAEQARGDLARAAGRLDAAGGSGPAAVLTRLELALERGERLPAPAIADALALAATLRDTGEGPAIMAAAVRQHLLAADLDAAFAVIDRLGNWHAPSQEGTSLIGALTAAAWQAAAAAPDLALLTQILSRSDWRSGSLAAATRASLAQRLLALGMESEAGFLVSPRRPEDPPAPGADSPGLPTVDAAAGRAALTEPTGSAAAQVEDASPGTAREALAQRGDGTGDPGMPGQPGPGSPVPTPPLPLPAGHPGPLARASGLIAESAALRDWLGTLLAHPSPPPGALQ